MEAKKKESATLEELQSKISELEGKLTRKKAEVIDRLGFFDIVNAPAREIGGVVGYGITGATYTGLGVGALGATEIVAQVAGNEGPLTKICKWVGEKLSR